MWIGSLIGKLAYRVAGKRRRIAEINIRLCFPALGGQQQEQLVKDHFDSIGKGIIETALCWWGHESQLRRLYTVSGIEHLEKALAQGKGVILLSAHFTTLEIGGRLLSLDVPFHVLYRPHKNPLFEHVMHKARTRRFEKAIPKDHTRALLKSLSSGMPVWFAPDQNHAGDHSVFVPFFGIAASTLTTTARIAKLSGASVVPFFQQRLENERGYKLTLYPVLKDFPSGDLIKDTARINELIEQEVRKMPQQYLWVHRRFKTQASSEATPYD